MRRLFCWMFFWCVGVGPGWASLPPLGDWPISEAFLVHVDSLYASGEWGRAGELLRGATRRNCTDPRLWTRIATLADELEHSAEAERAYLRALELVPGHYVASFNLARLLALSGRGIDALERLATVRRRGDLDPDYWQLVGRIMLAWGMEDEASIALSRVLELAPERSEVVHLMERHGLEFHRDP